jgi:hypothetical protein
LKVEVSFAIVLDSPIVVVYVDAWYLRPVHGDELIEKLTPFINPWVPILVSERPKLDAYAQFDWKAHLLPIVTQELDRVEIDLGDPRPFWFYIDEREDPF